MAPPSEPSAAMLNLSALSFLLGHTTVTWCVTRSLQGHQIWSTKSWSNMPWPRLCLVLALLTSWLYLLLTGVLLFGAPPRHTEMRCTLGTLSCILFYGIIRGFIYLCLMERVHAVWSDGRRRRRSPMYCLCVVLITPLGGIAAFMVYQGIHYLKNGYCIIGIKHTASLTFMCYDIALNVFLTALFVAPLVRSTIRSARLKVIAKRAMVATAVGLLTTIVNGFVLYGLGGEEIIWVCLGACAADVVINTVAIYWAMQSQPRPKGSIHVSPVSLSHGTRAPPQKIDAENPVACGARNEPAARSTTVSGYGHRQEDTLSHATAATSSLSIPMIDIPQPTMRNPRHVDLYADHPSGSRLSLTLSATKAPQRESSKEIDIPLQGVVLVGHHVNDSEVYGSNVGAESRRN